MWQPQLGALRDHEVVTPDLYGRGRTIDAWAESVLADADGELAVVGASIGGYCALAMARIAPDRVRGLFLAGARAEADTPERRKGRAETIELVQREGPERLVEEMRAQLFAGDAPNVTWEQDPDRLIGALAAMRDRPDSSGVVASFAGPLLIAVGERDPFFAVEEARVLAASAQQGRLEVFPGAAHLPSLEQPERFNLVLADFLSD
jgi:pimeloyl-ACP methyl ester carboxylesterase